MKRNGITLRTAEAADRRGILDLLDHAYHCGWNEAYLDWKYDQCAFGPVVTWIAESQGAIVGMRSMRPLIMEYGGSEYRVALLFDLAVHSSFRRKGVFSRLVDYGTTWTVDHGYDISITFPNKRSQWEYRKRGNWVQLGSLNLVSKPLDLVGIVRKKIGLPGRLLALPLKALQHFFFPNRRPRGRMEIHVEAVAEYPEGIEQASSGLANRIRIKRNKAYMDWRYCRNPRITYHNLVAFDGGKPCGFAAGTVRDLLGLRLGLIADMAGEDEALDLLLFEMGRYFRSEKGDMIGITLSKTNPVYQRLSGKGRMISLPQAISPKTFLMFVCFHSKPPQISPLHDFSSWFISWGDWDVLEGAGVSL